MPTNNPIIKHKAGLLNLTKKFNNASRPCKVMGVSRDTFYRYQELVEQPAHGQHRTGNEAWDEIETAQPGYLSSQDTFYVGNLKALVLFINRPLLILTAK